MHISNAVLDGAYIQVSTNERLLFKLPGVKDCPALDIICAEIERSTSRFGTASQSPLAGQKRRLDSDDSGDRPGVVARYSLMHNSPRQTQVLAQPLSPWFPSTPTAQAPLTLSGTGMGRKRLRDSDGLEASDDCSRTVPRSSYAQHSPGDLHRPPLCPSPYLPVTVGSPTPYSSPLWAPVSRTSQAATATPPLSTSLLSTSLPTTTAWSPNLNAYRELPSPLQSTSCSSLPPSSSSPSSFASSPSSPYCDDHATGLLMDDNALGLFVSGHPLSAYPSSASHVLHLPSSLCPSPIHPLPPPDASSAGPEDERDNLWSTGSVYIPPRSPASDNKSWPHGMYARDMARAFSFIGGSKTDDPDLVKER